MCSGQRLRIKIHPAVGHFGFALVRVARMMDLALQLAATASSSCQPLQPETDLVVALESQALTVALQVECLYLQGRILSQADALDQAAVVYQRASDLWKKYGPNNNATNSASEALQVVPAQLTSNKGFLKHVQ
jgi:hypothetical protein